MLADAVREIMDDSGWMNRLFLKAEAPCRNRFQYEYLIEMVDLKSGDGKLLSTILKRAEKKLTTAEDLLYLAKTILLRFEDKAWAERIRKRAEAAPADIPDSTTTPKQTEKITRTTQPNHQLQQGGIHGKSQQTC
jgi:hypothetical protein